MRGPILCLALVAMTRIALAEGDKPMAVLGLEVVGQTDFESTTVARNLTNGLRGLAGLPPVGKDLIDEKLTHGCESESPACMAQIAAQLGAKALVFGRIERTARDGRAGYELALKALDVDSQRTTPFTTWIPLADVGSSELDRWAGQALDAVLQRRVANAVVAPTPVPAVAGPPSPRRAVVAAPATSPGRGWRITAAVSGGLTVALLSGFTFSALKVQSLSDACTRVPGTDRFTADSPDGCADGTRYESLSFATGIGAIAVGSLALYATYKGYIASHGTSERAQVVGVRKKKAQFAVTPVVSPDGAGATMRIDW